MFRLDRIVWQCDATGHGMQASVEELQGAEETDRRAKEKAVKQAAAEAAAEKRKATLARVERMKDWDDEEVRMLEKALDKFPQVGIFLGIFLCHSRHPPCLSQQGVVWVVIQFAMDKVPQVDVPFPLPVQ